MTLARDELVDIGRYALLSSLTLVIGGCDRGDSASGSVAVRDSAGVTIVENRSHDGPDLAWIVDDTPLVELGRAEGDGAEVFAYIRHVIRLRTGALAVADAGAREIRVFDQAGRHAFTVGRQGEGPGEFTNLWRIAQVRGDSIAAIDNRLGRVSLFSPDGEIGRSYPIPRLAGGSAPNVQGFLDNGDMVVSTAATGSPARQSTVLVYTVDPEGRIAHQLGEYPDRERGSNGLGLVFGGAANVGVGGSIVWYAHSSTFEVQAIDPQGSLMQIIRMDRTPRSVTDEEVAAARASEEESLRRQGASRTAAERILASEFATSHPVMARILVDDAGYLWVARYPNTLVPEASTAEQRETWDVFAPRGGLRGRVTFPTGFWADEVFGDLVVGVHTDDTGGQRVRAYRVSRQ